MPQSGWGGRKAVCSPRKAIWHSRSISATFPLFSLLSSIQKQTKGSVLSCFGLRLERDFFFLLFQHAYWKRKSFCFYKPWGLLVSSWCEELLCQPGHTEGVIPGTWQQIHSIGLFFGTVPLLLSLLHPHSAAATTNGQNVNNGQEEQPRGGEQVFYLSKTEVRGRELWRPSPYKAKVAK